MRLRLMLILAVIQTLLSSIALVFAFHTRQSMVIANDGIDRHVEQLLLARGSAVLIQEIMSTQGFWLLTLGVSSFITAITLIALIVHLKSKPYAQ